MKPKKVLRLLAEALESHIGLLGYGEFRNDSAFTDGFIVDLTNNWVVMHEIDDGGGKRTRQDQPLA